ncbi:cupin domain-containing protein [Brevibacillus sp. 179-C9.3 HS]|uniref:cupin domain-containing protein n=1 Tax=unclassified Brevibacillus TaxID=2684853 RepID=UPI0039A0965D
MSKMPYVRQTDQENTRKFLGSKVTFLVNGDDTDGQYTVLHFHEQKGLEPPPHIHYLEDEAFYVLEGEITYYIQGEAVHATPGTYVYAPRGIEHTFSLQTEEAKVLVTVYPSGFEQFVKELSVPLSNEAQPKPAGPPSEEEVKKLVTTAAKYGIDIRVPHPKQP